MDVEKIRKILRDKRKEIMSGDPEESMKAQIGALEEIGVKVPDHQKPMMLRGAKLRKEILDLPQHDRLSALGYALVSEGHNQCDVAKDKKDLNDKVDSFTSTMAHVIGTYVDNNPSDIITLSENITKLALERSGVDKRLLRHEDDEEPAGNIEVKPPPRGIFNYVE